MVSTVLDVPYSLDSDLSRRHWAPQERGRERERERERERRPGTNRLDVLGGG